MDTSSTDAASNAAAAGFIGVLIVVYIIFLVALIAFFIWIYWRIFTKAGYSGALAFLNLVPGVGQLICILILAFGRWPIEDQLAAHGGTLPPAGTPPSTI